MGTMPKQKPATSRQDYQTPTELLDAVRRRLRISQFEIDVAASRRNKVCDLFLSRGTNALGPTMPWATDGGWGWCNPPYRNIAPWVGKAQLQADQGAKTAVLVPASVGANWWRDWVDGRAYALLLNGRVTFVGETTPYPKDCAVLLYTPEGQHGYEVWNWQEEGR